MGTREYVICCIFVRVLTDRETDHGAADQQVPGAVDQQVPDQVVDRLPEQAIILAKFEQKLTVLRRFSVPCTRAPFGGTFDHALIYQPWCVIAQAKVNDNKAVANDADMMQWLNEIEGGDREEASLDVPTVSPD